MYHHVDTRRVVWEWWGRDGDDAYCVSIDMLPEDLDKTVRDVFGPYSPRNNAARIRAMTDQELADFLHEVGVAEPPWDKEFSRTFCNNCMACENAVGLIDCPHGRPVDWWLEQEAAK